MASLSSHFHPARLLDVPRLRPHTFLKVQVSSGIVSNTNYLGTYIFLGLFGFRTGRLV
jgi:hypothetical protein